MKNKKVVIKQDAGDIEVLSQSTSTMLNTVNPDLSMEDIFNSPEESQNVVKEIFSIKSPKVKTDLTEQQISIISRLYYMSDLTDNAQYDSDLKNLLNEFITLRISKDRKSRQEFVEAFRSKEEQKSGGLFNRIGGLFNKTQ